MSQDLDFLMSLLPVLIPVILISVGLMIASVIHIANNRKSLGQTNMIVWLLICVFLNLIGPILYFTIGRNSTHDD